MLRGHGDRCGAEGTAVRANVSGEAGAKEAGKMRLEGKEYVVKDGDILMFRFNT